MVEHITQLLEDYDQNKSIYESFESDVKRILETLFISENFQPCPHLITSRVKAKNSLHNKLKLKGEKYKQIGDIKDIVGMRIITYLQDDIDKIAQKIEEEFEIDRENSPDKSAQVEETLDRFGYKSRHFVASLSASRLQEPHLSKYKGLQFELQIRTILQHSWATMEHDIYKGRQIAPSAKRTFYRIAALLELADIEFVKLKEEIQQYQNRIATELKLNQTTGDIPVNLASLEVFIKANDAIAQIIGYAMEHNGFHLFGEEATVIDDMDIFNLKVLGFTTLAPLEKFIDENVDEIKQLFADYTDPQRPTTMPVGPWQYRLSKTGREDDRHFSFKRCWRLLLEIIQVLKFRKK
ncbi:hypothetical protein QNI16_14605 [Cytophagaceae bacterium YF14B1]|uniref:RelA/SpoT domain-containing protein n=1 Tax=Xanthocytophaga flava TaxID=3048013 RepID=A0AAE3U905_9BACT|nr:hypothetical protein [Xanthocytophaga flavus]MDJ1481728.1 hypothetical protein [Xanthocytophaga flavus]